MVRRIGIIRLGIPMAALAHATADSELHEVVHVRVGDEIELLLRVLQHSIPSEAWRSIVVGWIQSVSSHARSPEVFEDVSQQKHIRFEIESGVFT